MKIISLVENNPGHPLCRYEHGLCLYVETKKHRLLLDAGPSDALLDNAAALGIDLRQVDTLVLSHGHYDHAGGILPFAALNPTAQIYLQRSAALEYYHGARYIGIDPAIARLPQVHLLDGDTVLDDELSLFSGITGRRHWPQSNLLLSQVVQGMARQDEFAHEQCLVITQGQERYLLSGCAHNGILNILDRYRALYGNAPKVAVTGFHMMKKTDYTPEEISVIKETAQELSQMDTLFISGHCTGAAFDLMKPIMGNQLCRLSSGAVIWED